MEDSIDQYSADILGSLSPDVFATTLLTRYVDFFALCSFRIRGLGPFPHGPVQSDKSTRCFLVIFCAMTFFDAFTTYLTCWNLEVPKSEASEVDKGTRLSSLFRPEALLLLALKSSLSHSGCI